MNKLFLICHFRPEICDSFSFIQKHFESKRVLKNWLHTIQGFPILIWGKIIRVTVLCFTLPLPFKLNLFMLIFKHFLWQQKNVRLSTKNSKLKDEYFRVENVSGLAKSHQSTKYVFSNFLPPQKLLEQMKKVDGLHFWNFFFWWLKWAHA